ncbi:MAG: metallopeptidase family protein [Sandaracinaceae bacterium]|nr:metallopeptidase family protein [Sandaracinaceae bacterium]
MATPSRVLDRIDEVFDALERGDLAGAEALMALPRRKGAASRERLWAEAHLAMAGQDLDAARDWIAQTIAADPSWWQPHVDAALLHWEAGDADGAYAALVATRDALDPRDPEGWLELGELALDFERPREAADALAHAVEHDPEDPDVWYALGAALHALGERDAATDAWLRTRALDLAGPRPPWKLTHAELEALAERTLRELPAEVRDGLVNVPILVEDAPSEAHVREGIDPRLLGLFTGTPLPEKGESGSTPNVDNATLYLRNIEAMCDDREQLEEQIWITLLHETAHFYGLEDEDLEALGLG